MLHDPTTSPFISQSEPDVIASRASKMTGEAKDAIYDRLRYPLDGRWVTLPHWARFFIRLGTAVSSSSPAQGKARLVIAVSIPARPYAAALSAVGAVFARAGNPFTADIADHLAVLRSLPSGAPVIKRSLVTGTKREKGMLVGFVVENGKEYIQFQSGMNLRSNIPIERADCLEPLVASKSPVRLPKVPRVTTVATRPGLITGVLGPTEAARFANHSRLECILVGNRSALEAEIVGAPFAARSGDGQVHKGRLQDILRAKTFLPQGDCSRSEILSLTAKSVSSPALETPTVIFDGARALLRCSVHWPAANWIVILNRTEWRFADGVALVDDVYEMSDSVALGTSFPPPPLGIEYTAFQTRRVLA